MNTFKQFLESRNDELRKALEDITANLAKYGSPVPPQPIDTDPDLLKWEPELLEFNPELAKWTHELLHKRKDQNQTAKEFKKWIEMRNRAEMRTRASAPPPPPPKPPLPPLEDFIKEYKPKRHPEKDYGGYNDGMKYTVVSTSKSVPHELRQLIARSLGDDFSFKREIERTPKDNKRRHYYEVSYPSQSI
jgi:hypothetical protein